MQEARHVSDPSRIKQLVEEAQEAADFIRTAVVQAKLNDRGNYGEWARAPASLDPSPLLERGSYLGFLST